MPILCWFHWELTLPEEVIFRPLTCFHVNEPRLFLALHSCITLTLKNTTHSEHFCLCVSRGLNHFTKPESVTEMDGFTGLEEEEISNAFPSFTFTITDVLDLCLWNEVECCSRFDTLPVLLCTAVV